MIESAYELLRVEKNASPETVRNAYVRLVRRYPPEHFPEKFVLLRNAYQQLTLNDDFLAETTKRVLDGDGAIELAACLWGDRKELVYDPQFNPGELVSLFEREETRHALDKLLAAEPEIEWRTGD